MYSEDLTMAPRLRALLVLPFLVPLAVLATILLRVPLPWAGRLPLIGALLAVAAVPVLLVVGLAHLRVTVDAQAVTVASRFTRRRTPLARIAACAPSDARVWGTAYTYRGTMYRPRASGGRAVVLTLTNGAQLAFPSRHPDAVCDALRAYRPEIARAS